jgi:hypothetical protein
MTKRNILSRLSHIMWRSDLEATRLGLALGSLLWAGFLFWPGELFTPTRTTYHVMAEIMPEYCWAAAFLLQGCVMLYSLLWGYRSKLSFVADALLGCVLWTTSTAACFMAHYNSLATYQPPAAMSYELVGALASWWCLVRYSVEKKGGK